MILLTGSVEVRLTHVFQVSDVWLQPNRANFVSSSYRPHLQRLHHPASSLPRGRVSRCLNDPKWSKKIPVGVYFKAKYHCNTELSGSHNGWKKASAPCDWWSLVEIHLYLHSRSCLLAVNGSDADLSASLLQAESTEAAESSLQLQIYDVRGMYGGGQLDSIKPDEDEDGRPCQLRPLPPSVIVN